MRIQQFYKQELQTQRKYNTVFLITKIYNVHIEYFFGYYTEDVLRILAL